MVRVPFFASMAMVLGAALITLATSENPAGAQWRVGLAAVEITPVEPVPMGGFAGRHAVFGEVLSPIYAKAMAIEDEQGTRAVIVTCDILGFQRWFTEPLVGRLMKRTGLARERILLCASHTHTGPLLGLDSRYVLDEDVRRRVERYVEKLCDDIIEVVETALGDMQPAELSHHVGEVGFPMNRRQPDAQGRIHLGANPDGPVDRTVPVLRVTSPRGEVRGVLMGASCHPTTLGAVHAICADYPGYAQARIEEALPGAHAMFIQGCAGDAGPHPSGTVDLARQHGRSLGDEVVRLVRLPGRLVRGPLRTTFDKVQTPLLAMNRPDDALAWPHGDFTAHSLRQRLAAGTPIPTHYPCPVATWQFGDDLTLVTLSGEVVVDYVALIQQAIGAHNVWIASYAHENFGYLPSARVLREGGYETRGIIYGGDHARMDGAYGIFAPEAEEVIVEAVRRQARRVGRRGMP